MQHILRHSIALPDWQAASARRLNISMLIATVVVAAVLSVLRFPSIELITPLAELVVNIIHTEKHTAGPPLAMQAPGVPIPQTEAPIGEIASRTERPDDVVPATIEPITGVAPAADSPIEWEEEKAAAVQAAVDAMQETVSVNPNFDQRRKEAARRFRPSEAPAKREIWDNVGKDQLGRTILQSGNCFRVIDDPSVANRWAFENFDQYISYCTYQKYVGHELPWVEEIRDRHAYLRERERRRNGIFEADPDEP